MAKRLSSLPTDAENASVSMASTTGAQYRHGVKIWFTDECTQKKGGLASLVSSNKPKNIYVLPGKVCWVKAEATDAETERFVLINAQLTATATKKEVTLEFPDTVETSKTRGKPIKETFLFNSEQAANAFVQAIQQEKTRNYVVSANFTPKFQNDLNIAIRALIDAGDAPLKEMYLSTFNNSSPATGIEALFTNYRSLTDSEEAPASAFAKLLSAAAQDPVIYILFLCCHLEASQAMMDHFQGICNSIIDNYVQLFDELLRHIHITVSKHEWKLKRDLLLAQFQYPAINTGTAGLNEDEVVEWTRRFTNDYRKFNMSIGTLNRLLVDEKFLCFVCLQHHADKGYVQIVRDSFLAVPQEYLFTRFDINLVMPGMEAEGEEEGAGGDNPWHRPNMQRTNSLASPTNRHHFVDFLFHRNLNEKSAFLAILHAFQCGQGYDDKFFAMFLNEAIQKDKPRVAVDVINTILFTEAGEPSVHALKFCPKIPIIIFEAILKGMFNANGEPTAHKVSDYLRLLFEISMRFEYFCKKTELNYIKTVARLFKDSPEKRVLFMKLVEVTGFLSYMTNLCDFNLAGRADKENLSAHIAANKPRRQENNDDETITTVSVDDESAHHSAGPTPTNMGSAGSGSFFAQRRQGSIFGSLSNDQLGGARGAEMPVKWLERNDSNLIALIYGFLTLVVRCGPVPAVKDNVAQENVTVKTFLEALPTSFFTIMLKPGTALRARITEFFREQFLFVSLYDELLGDASMLCKAEHFRYSFLHALAYDAHYLSNLFIAVVITVTKLEEYDSLYSKFHDLDFDMGLSQEKQQQLSTVLEYVINRDSSELVRHGIVLQDIRNFVHDVTNKLNEVRGNAEQKRGLVERVRKILTAESVGTWRRSFDVIAGRTPAPSPSPSPTSALDSNNTSGQFRSAAAASALAMETPQEEAPHSTVHPEAPESVDKAGPARSTALPSGLTAEQKKASEAAWAAHSAMSRDQDHQETGAAPAPASAPAQATFAAEAAAVVHAREEAREFEKAPLPDIEATDAAEVEVEIAAEPEPAPEPEVPVEAAVEQSTPVEETPTPAEEAPAPVEEASASAALEETAQQAPVDGSASMDSAADTSNAEVPATEATVEVEVAPEVVTEEPVPQEQEVDQASAEPKPEALAAEQQSGTAAALSESEPEQPAEATAAEANAEAEAVGEVEGEVESESLAEAYVDASAPPCEESEAPAAATEERATESTEAADAPTQGEGSEAKDGKKAKGKKGILW